MGTAVKTYGSENSYNSAAQDRANSQRLQSTWEQERKQSLDSENYRVEEDKYGKWKKENGF